MKITPLASLALMLALSATLVAQQPPPARPLSPDGIASVQVLGD